MRLAVFLLSLFIAAPATAQDWRAPSAQRDPISAIADQHRYEMDRLRAQAAEREMLARQQRLESRLTVLDLQAARQPAPPAPAPTAYVRSPEEARQAREAAAARQEDFVRGVGEIDAWLDRPRP